MVPSKALILCLLLLAGCQTAGGSFCDIAKPIRTPIEDMTPAEAREALSINEKGAALCGWRP
jgi:hypothetical protein